MDLDGDLPAFRQATHDRALRGTLAIEVYAWAIEYLDVQEFRPLKIAALACALHVSETAAYRAVRRLEARGYFDRLPGNEHPARYRLFVSRHEDSMMLPAWMRE